MSSGDAFFEKDGGQREAAPKPEMIVGIDHKVIPIEDVGVRESVFQKTIRGREKLQHSDGLNHEYEDCRQNVRRDQRAKRSWDDCKEFAFAAGSQEAVGERLSWF